MVVDDTFELLFLKEVQGKKVLALSFKRQSLRRVFGKAYTVSLGSFYSRI